MHFFSKYFEQEICFLRYINTSWKWHFKVLVIINENLLFCAILKSVICFKSLIMALHYLNTKKKMNRIYYYIIQFYKKGKGMKCAKHPSVFLTGFLPLAKNLLIPSPLGNTPRKTPPAKFSFPSHQRMIPPFFMLKSIKIFMFSSHCSCTIFVLPSYSFYTGHATIFTDSPTP